MVTVHGVMTEVLYTQNTQSKCMRRSPLLVIQFGNCVKLALQNKKHTQLVNKQRNFLCSTIPFRFSVRSMTEFVVLKLPSFGNMVQKMLRACFSACSEMRLKDPVNTIIRACKHNTLAHSDCWLDIE